VYISKEIAMRRELAHRRPRRSPLSIGLLLLALGSAWAAGARAADWPQFRGPNRDGISRETGILKSWPEDGPRVLWKAPVGEGFSGITVAGGRLYTMEGRGGGENAVCLDAATGKQLWRVTLDQKYESGQGSGPRSTPTVAGDLVYMLTGNGKLFALRAATGKVVWFHDLVEEYSARPPQWGVATSPLVEGNLLLVDVGGAPAMAAMAFDRRTGKVAWSSQTDRAGYSAPIAFTVGGIRQALFFTGSSLASLSPADGRLYWRKSWQTDWDVNAATPIFVPPDQVFVSSGYDTGAALFRMKASGGKVAVEEVWRSKRMKNQFSSSVLWQGHIYGFDNDTFKCIEAATGEEKWRERGLGHGSLILADGHLFVLSERGRLALVEATPAEYREKASAEVLSGKCWTAPALAGGRLYLRNEETMVALDVAARPAPAAKKPAKGGR
jgi:outer membrane protein assembly factor BamB